MPGVNGKAVLVVEDDYAIAMDLAYLLRSAGCFVVGPAPRLYIALAVMRRRSIDAAVVDLDLRGEAAFPLMDRLEKDAVPFIIVTGFTRHSIPDRFARYSVVSKPYLPSEVLAALAAALAARARSTAAATGEGRRPSATAPGVEESEG